MIPLRTLAAAGPLLLSLTQPLLAEVPEEASRAIAESLTRALPGVEHGAVRESPIPGLYQVELEGGLFLFATADGRYLINGELYESRPEGLANLTEEARKVERRRLLAELAPDEAIVFPARAGRRAVLWVFTDVDCGYCRRFHQEVPALNEAGVEVRYLAFPRTGPGTPSADRLATAWCSEDRRAALTALKAGKAVPVRVCADNPVARHYRLGERLGVQGTPALYLADGTSIPGYRPAAELLEIVAAQGRR
ncbi:MAG: glutaredoxin [Porticoccaceae bacterium]|nr:MAG: glutaredoxin [Porticoccaceae bacterium]